MGILSNLFGTCRETEEVIQQVKKDKDIQLSDFIDLDVCNEFINDCKEMTLTRLSDKYYFIKYQADIDRFRVAFSLILCLCSLTEAKPEKKQDKQVKENMSVDDPILKQFALTVVDNIRNMSEKDAHKKYDDFIGKSGVDLLIGKKKSTNVDKRKLTAIRNKEILADEKQSREFMKVWSRSLKEAEQVYDMSETAVYNLKRRILAKYGDDILK